MRRIAAGAALAVVVVLATAERPAPAAGPDGCVRPHVTDGMGAAERAAWLGRLAPSAREAEERHLADVRACLGRERSRQRAAARGLAAAMLAAREDGRRLAVELPAFGADPAGCTSPHLDAALAAARGLVRAGTARDAGGRVADPKAAADAGARLLDVADAARGRGCRDAAGDAYRDVIRIYYGEADGGLRRRAGMGLGGPPE